MCSVALRPATKASVTTSSVTAASVPKQSVSLRPMPSGFKRRVTGTLNHRVRMSPPE